MPDPGPSFPGATGIGRSHPDDTPVDAERSLINTLPFSMLPVADGANQSCHYSTPSGISFTSASIPDTWPISILAPQLPCSLNIYLKCSAIFSLAIPGKSLPLPGSADGKRLDCKMVNGRDPSWHCIPTFSAGITNRLWTSVTLSSDVTSHRLSAGPRGHMALCSLFQVSPLLWGWGE